jgi:glycosyltransferase involved in cell wall biosynthesis
MNVVFLSKSLGQNSGGLLPVMQKLGTNLKDFGVYITSMGIKGNEKDENDDGWGSLISKSFPCHGPRSIGYSPEMYYELLSINPDMVHTHGLFYYTSAIAKKWGRMTSKPYLVTPHGMLDSWALNNSRWKKNIAGFLFENDHLRGANCIHSLCSSETDSIRAYGLRNPICQIPNGVDVPGDKELKLESPWHDKIETGKKVLLFLGRIHPKKGLPSLLTAWGKVQKSNPHGKDWVFALAGWDQLNHEYDLKSQVKSAGLESSVCFLGPQFNEYKLACYQNADAFILPSLSEGLPMVVLEAWAHKLPVIMTPECNIPEGFKANAAIKIDSEVKSIEDGLCDFFSLSGKEQVTMGHNGFELVKSSFTWDKVAKDMYSVYQWILGSGSLPDCVLTD